jgi:hypothetical protein
MDLTTQEWSLRWLTGMVSSCLRGGSMGKSTIEQIDGAKVRIQSSLGVTEAQSRAAIATGIEQSPNKDSNLAKEFKKRYLQ